MPRILISPEIIRHVEGEHTRLLQEAGFEFSFPEKIEYGRGDLTVDATVKQLHDFDAVIAAAEFISANVLERLPKLRVIARFGVGYDRVDVPAATKQRIPVTITPNSNHEAVAEHALAFVFAIAKSIVSSRQNIRSGVWDRTPTNPVRGNNFGVMGLGRIGRSVAKRGAALGMNVLVTETNPDHEFLAQHNIRLVDFETLVAESDFLSVHCPLNEQTSGMFNADVFRRMKPGSSFINTARGGLMVESDLADALSSGHLKAAGLDVFGQEPPESSNPLLSLDNVIMTPHSASDSLAQQDMAKESARCVVRLFQGSWPDGCVVNDELKNGWSW